MNSDARRLALGLLDMSVEDLIRQVGRDVTFVEAVSGGRRTGVGYAAPSAEDAYEAGKRWLASREASLRKLICDDWDYCGKRGDPSWSDPVNLVYAVADLIASIYVGIGPFTVAALLSRQGLDRYCGCRSRRSDNSSASS